MSNHFAPANRVVDMKLAVLLGNSVLSFVRGYELINVASLQQPIRDTFRLSGMLFLTNTAYPLAMIAAMPMARDLVNLSSLRWLGSAACVVNMLGALLAGLAKNSSAFVCGRVLMAFGSAILFHLVLCYNIRCTHPQKSPIAQGIVWGFYALGLLSGLYISEALASSNHTTWREAFLIEIPLLSIPGTLIPIKYPSLRSTGTFALRDCGKQISLMKFASDIHRKGDLTGNYIWALAMALLGIGFHVSASPKAWPTSIIALIWVLCATSLITYVYHRACRRQYKRISSGEQFKKEPFWSILTHERNLSLLLLCTVFSSATFGAVIFCTPLYAFFSGLKGIPQTSVSLTPFIVGLIAAMVFSGWLSVMVPYLIVFVTGPTLMLYGGIWYQVGPVEMSIQILSWTQAVVGFGAGVMFQSFLAIAYVTLRHRFGYIPEQNRVDAVTLFTIAQMGGICFALVSSELIYRGVGLALISDSSGGNKIAKETLSEILAGAAASQLLENKDLFDLVSPAARTALRRCFFLHIFNAFWCFIALCCMRLERLPMRRSKPDLSDYEGTTKAG